MLGKFFEEADLLPHIQFFNRLGDFCKGAHALKLSSGVALSNLIPRWGERGAAENCSERVNDYASGKPRQTFWKLGTEQRLGNIARWIEETHPALLAAEPDLLRAGFEKIGSRLAA